MKTGNFLYHGDVNAPYLVITDVPSKHSFKAEEPMPPAYHKLFAYFAKQAGFKSKEFAFLSPSPPFPAGTGELKSLQNAHLKEHREEFLHTVCNFGNQAFVSLGALAAQQLMGQPVKITRVRGTVTKLTDFTQPLVGLMAPSQVLRMPRNELNFRADFQMVTQLAKANYDPNNLQFDLGSDYRWTDARGLYQYMADSAARKNGAPLGVAIDTETIGGRWHEGAAPTMCQFTTDMGTARAIPLHPHLIARVLAGELQEKTGKPIFSYVKDDPDSFHFSSIKVHNPTLWNFFLKRGYALAPVNHAMVKRIIEEEDFELRFTGQNFKYDIQVLNNVGIIINVEHWAHDTMQLSFLVEEAIPQKDLGSLAKIFVPPKSGYSDSFESKVDYAHMDTVMHGPLGEYGCADTDVTMQVTKRIVPDQSADEKHWRCYERIQMPALRMFVDVEKAGIKVDVERLREFSKKMDLAEASQYQELITGSKDTVGNKDGFHTGVDPMIRRKWWDPKNKNRQGLSFTRDDFLLDQCFLHPKGLKIEPKVFTPSGPPSTAAKTHLAFFEEEPWIAAYMQYNKVATLRTNFLGKEEKKTGIWQYLGPDECIHPSYWLSRTVTGRTASSDPNGQNIPKRGDLAMEYRRVFIPHVGYVFLEVDLSQAELRIAAWMAKERNMIALYLAGEDIHLNTAAAISGIPLAKFKLGLKCEIPLMDVANDWKGASAYLLTLRSEDRKVWHDPKTGELKGATVKSYLKSLRQRAKAVNFGFLYGMGARKFRAYAKTDYGVTVSLEEAEAMREMFFTLYPDLLKWHEEMREYVNQFAYIRSLHGALRHLQDIYSVDEGIRRATERQAINSGVQRFASDWALMGAIRFHRDLKIKHQQEGGKKEAFISAFVHDAVIGQVRKDTELIERYASYMKWYMESVPITEWFGITPPLPITADVSLCSDSLGEVKELHHVIAQKPDWFTGD